MAGVRRPPGRRWRQALGAAVLAAALGCRAGEPGGQPPEPSTPGPSTPPPPVTPSPPPPPTEPPTSSPGESAQLVRVVDGDTIDVRLGREVRRVRYIGIDTPEHDQCFFQAATARNAELLRSGPLQLERDVSETDRYGRLLRYVWAGGVFVNAELVREGYAQAATYPPDVRFADLFVRLQREAREAGRGLWSRCPVGGGPAAARGRPVSGSRSAGGAGAGCHPSYPDFCIPPPPPDLDCRDVGRRGFTVRWDVPDPDPHGFDRDRDGVGCE